MTKIQINQHFSSVCYSDASPRRPPVFHPKNVLQSKTALSASLGGRRLELNSNSFIFIRLSSTPSIVDYSFQT